MNNETNRLAQLIATAAHKELAVRPDGIPRRQDKAAAEAIEAEYLFIRRSELPKVEIIDRDGIPHVDVGSPHGTWALGPKTDPARNRSYGLEYLVVSEAIQEWHAREAEMRLYKRRDELAAELGCPGLYPTLIHNAPMKLAIDRIIALEQEKAA